MNQVGEDEQPRAERQLAPNDECPAVTDHDELVDLRQQTHRRLVKTQSPEDVVLLVLDGAIGRAEAGDLVLFTRETLDDLNPLHILGQTQDQPVAQFAAALVERTNSLREQDGSHKQQGRGDQACAGERRVDRQHVG